MVYRCCAFGCSNSSSENISLFRFPKDPVLRKQWEKQVQRTRAQWKATESSRICSEHFTQDSFEADSALASQFGMKKRCRLKSGAIPTFFDRPFASGSATNSRKRSSASVRGAVEKRRRHEVKIVFLLVNFQHLG